MRTTATMSAVPPPAPLTASARAARERDDAGQAEGAVRGQVGLGDQETCAGAQQQDAQEHHGSGHRSAARSRGRPLDRPPRLRDGQARSCRPRAGRCSATATASACARGPARACAAPGARASASWRSRWRSRPRWTRPRWPSPRAAQARTGSASSTPTATASPWPRVGSRRRARRRAAPGASGGSPRAGASSLADGAGRGRAAPVAVGGFAFAPDGGSTPHVGRLRARVAARARGGAGAPRRAR